MSDYNSSRNTKFQLERLILFSDAVFAIAITLLVIEMKIPHLVGRVSDAAIMESLQHLLPVFFGVILSFFIIGIYWTVHHRIFGQVVSYDGRLLWLNLLFLFSIILMPFTSALYGEYYYPNVLVPHLIYTLNICLTGLCNVLLIRHINNPSKHLKSDYSEPESWRFNYAGALMMPIVLVFGFLISYFTIPWIGRMSPLMIPIYMVAVRRRQ